MGYHTQRTPNIPIKNIYKLLGMMEEQGYKTISKYAFMEILRENNELLYGKENCLGGKPKRAMFTGRVERT